MKILKYKKLKDNKYNISLDNGTDIKLYDDLIVKYNILCMKDLDSDKVDELIEENSRLESYYKALKYITIKMRTETEIRKYLGKTYDKKTIDETISKIKKEGYINEERYLKLYVDDRVNLSNVGPNKIVDELVKLGYKDGEVRDYLRQVDIDVWEDKLEKLVQKKVNSNHGYGINRLKDKITYEMVNNGYDKYMVLEVLDRVDIPKNDSLLEKEYNKFYNKLSKKYDGDKLLYQVKNKLIYKGFRIDEIDELIEKNRRF